MEVLAGAALIVLMYDAYRSRQDAARANERADRAWGNYQENSKWLVDHFTDTMYEAEQDFLQERRDLLRQSQSMAERIATLRTEGLTEGGDVTFTPTRKEKPYSTELQTFLSGIESENGRIMLEEQIETLRAGGMDDDQIYRIVREGEDV